MKANNHILILFGSGASNGSEKEENYCPPLGKNLHIFCSEHSSDWKKALQIPTLGEILESYGFEKFMLELNKLNTDLFYKCHLDCARLLFRFLPTKENLYGIFVQRLLEMCSDATITLATLNYDRLLPLSLTDYGILPYSINGIGNTDFKFTPFFLVDPTNCILKKRKEIEIILPHGASYLFTDSSFYNIPQEILELIEPDTEDPIIKNFFAQQHIEMFGRKIIPIHDEKKFMNKLSLYEHPAMSFIHEFKDTQGSGVPYVYYQRLYRLKEISMSVDTIVVIGVNYQKHDKFWESILPSRATKKIQFGGDISIPDFQFNDLYFKHENFHEVINKIIK